MTTTINAVASTGLVQTSDGSGVIKVQSNGVTTNALAWVNFNGVTTTSIRSSYNISSVTRNGTGDYTVNFATALSDANYAVVMGGTQAGAGSNPTYNLTKYNGTYSTSACQIVSIAGDRSALQDNSQMSVAFFGN